MKLLTQSLNKCILLQIDNGNPAFFPTFAVTNNDPAMNPPPPPAEIPAEIPAKIANAPVCDLRTLRSDELLQGQVEVLIAHGNDTYRLRLTRSGKLILQK